MWGLPVACPSGASKSWGSGKGAFDTLPTYTHNPRAAGDEAPLPTTLCGSVLSLGLG